MNNAESPESCTTRAPIDLNFMRANRWRGSITASKTARLCLCTRKCRRNLPAAGWERNWSKQPWSTPASRASRLFLLCSYAAAYIRRNQQYQALLEPSGGTH